MNFFILETRELLKERKSEVERHLEFAKVLIDSKASKLAVVRGNDSIEVNGYEIDRRLVKTISATGYLLIYNMIESVMTSALHAVHQQVQNDQLTFSQLSEKLKEVCLGNFREGFGKKYTDEYVTLTMNEALVWLGYKKNRHWNGNVDARKIREKTKRYGIEVVYREGDLSEIQTNFLDIRNKRNDLAHGELSFEQCGQDTPIDALITYCSQAYRYLEAVVDGVENYLMEKKYAAVC